MQPLEKRREPAKTVALLISTSSQLARMIADTTKTFKRSKASKHASTEQKRSMMARIGRRQKVATARSCEASGSPTLPAIFCQLTAESCM